MHLVPTSTQNLNYNVPLENFHLCLYFFCLPAHCCNFCVLRRATHETHLNKIWRAVVVLTPLHHPSSFNIISVSTSGSQKSFKNMFQHGWIFEKKLGKNYEFELIGFGLSNLHFENFRQTTHDIFFAFLLKYVLNIVNIFWYTNT